MNIEEIAIKLQETTDRSVRNEGRIKKLETGQDTIRSLATSVAVMAEQMKTMNNNVHTLSGKVDELEQKPAKRWDSIVEKIIWAVLSVLIGIMLGQGGIS